MLVTEDIDQVSSPNLFTSSHSKSAVRSKNSIVILVNDAPIQPALRLDGFCRRPQHSESLASTMKSCAATRHDYKAWMSGSIRVMISLFSIITFSICPSTSVDNIGIGEALPDFASIAVISFADIHMRVST